MMRAGGLYRVKSFISIYVNDSINPGWCFANGILPRTEVFMILTQGKVFTRVMSSRGVVDIRRMEIARNAELIAVAT